MTTKFRMSVFYRALNIKGRLLGITKIATNKMSFSAFKLPQLFVMKFGRPQRRQSIGFSLLTGLTSRSRSEWAHARIFQHVILMLMLSVLAE